MPPSAATTSSMLEDYIKRMNIDGKILASNMDSGVRGGSWMWFLVSELYYGGSAFKSWSLF